MHSHLATRCRERYVKPVLILVVMEDALARIDGELKLMALFVLILVVMEDALAQMTNTYLSFSWKRS